MKKRIGVLVGRFQVPRLALHPGYRALLARVAQENDAVLVVLGEAPAPDARNPLSFAHRRAMFAEEYPAFRVAQLADEPSDAEWVRHLDVLLAAVQAEENAELCLYGGRQSFLETYRAHGGRFRTEYVAELGGQPCCATDIRRRLAQEQRSSVGVRTGLILAYTPVAL